MYHLSDMEEDEEGEESNGIAVLEKGAAERCKEECNNEEEEGGITFNVCCSSTPEDRKDRCCSAAPLSPTLPTSSGTSTSFSSSSVRSDLHLTPDLVEEKSSPSPHIIPGAPAQTQSLIPTSAASSCGTVSLYFSVYVAAMVKVSHGCCLFSPEPREVSELHLLHLHLHNLSHSAPHRRHAGHPQVNHLLTG